MFEPQLKELRGSSRLALGFFNSLIRRIECTKPISGTGVQLVQSPDGIIISSDATAVASNFKEYALNVCSGGAITTITVYGP